MPGLPYPPHRAQPLGAVWTALSFRLYGSARDHSQLGWCSAGPDLRNLTRGGEGARAEATACYRLTRTWKTHLNIKRHNTRLCTHQPTAYARLLLGLGWVSGGGERGSGDFYTQSRAREPPRASGVFVYPQAQRDPPRSDPRKSWLRARTRSSVPTLGHVEKPAHILN